MSGRGCVDSRALGVRDFIGCCIGVITGVGRRTRRG